MPDSPPRQPNIGKHQAGLGSAGRQLGQQLLYRAYHQAARKLGLRTKISAEHLANSGLVFNEGKLGFHLVKVIASLRLFQPGLRAAC